MKSGLSQGRVSGTPTATVEEAAVDGETPKEKEAAEAGVGTSRPRTVESGGQIGNGELLGFEGKW
jgi:hypothetical protein